MAVLNAHRVALRKALLKAGDIARRGLAGKVRIAFKGPVNLVTTADKAADKAILGVLKKRFPGHNFLTEESSPRRTGSGHRWIIDPLDGTTNFAHGLPHACVSIALEENGRIMLGGVLDPFRRELFWAERGRGAALNGKKIQVSKAKKLIQSLLVTGFPYDRQKRARYYLKSVEAFLKSTQGVRRLGAAALDLSYVASGRFDGYWEYFLNPWDVAAGWLLVEEAGGRVTDYAGRPYGFAQEGRVLASNGLIHGQMVEKLKRIAPAPGASSEL